MEVTSRMPKENKSICYKKSEKMCATHLERLPSVVDFLWEYYTTQTRFWGEGVLFENT